MPAPLKLLLVEDVPDDAELVLMELRRGGFQLQAVRVETAAAMAAALAGGDWDLVLSDYQLPEFDGMAALRTVQATGRDIPFILVSGAIGEDVAVAAVKAGAHGYVLKQNLIRLCPVVARELKDAAARAEQRLAKQELRLSEERYRALFEHSPMPLSVQDLSGLKERFDRYRAQGIVDLRRFFAERPDELRLCAQAVRIKEGNEARRRFFTGDDADASVMDFCSVFADATWDGFQGLVVALWEGALTCQGELAVRAAGGAVRVIALHLSVNPGFEQSLARVLVSFMDATERIRMEAALRDMDRVSAKGQMAAYVAHEINNPLAGIKNAFALLEPAIPLDHPHRHYADLIKREIDRIAGIIRTMYHVYRPMASDSKDVSLGEVFQDVLHLLMPKCRAAGAEIALDLPDPGLAVRFGEGPLHQVVFNLALNAVEASPRGGTVRMTGRKLGEIAEITVQDQGGGIAPECAARVFDPGFTTKLDTEMSGLGLGLATCKRLVEATGGSLDWLAADPGPGTLFRVRLPHPAEASTPSDTGSNHG